METTNQKSQTATTSLTKILCVDDEKAVLEGLSLNLSRRFEVATAISGAAGLECLTRDPAISVVISDMRMPGMDGAAFLTQARTLVPDTVRILLTGQADLESTVKVVNDGQIFRFLTKPCPPKNLLAAVESAVQQHRLLTAERVLLEQTLHGSIKALTDILALTNPVSFGRAGRIKDLVSELATAMELPNRWQLEVAAMLSQLWTITLPAETVEKLYFGKPLTMDEQKMVDNAPQVTDQLLRNIPRLEGVTSILAAQSRIRAKKEAADADPRLAEIDTAAQVLRAASDFDALDTQGSAANLAVDTMRGRATRYGPPVLDTLARLRGGQNARAGIREVFLAVLCAGMVFVDDVKNRNGTLLVARGFEVTPSFLERLRNMPPGTLKEPLRVTLKTVPARTS